MEWLLMALLSVMQCHVLGECTPDDACQRTVACAELGKCTTRNGVCVPGSDADCQESRQCKEHGYCHLNLRRPVPECFATSNEDCKSSDDCFTDGRCTHWRGSCFVAARTNAACRRHHGQLSATPCDLDGQCTARLGMCLATLKDCQHNSECHESGRCWPVDGFCTALFTGDCQNSNQCRLGGSCTLFNANYGYGYCAPGSDKDCHESLVCKQDGRCKLTLDTEDPMLKHCGP